MAFYFQEYTGLPLQSQKLVPGDTVLGVAEGVYTYREWLVTFTSGGALVVTKGMVLKDATITTTTAIVCSDVTLTGVGTWGAGTAAGSFRIKSVTGLWTSGGNVTCQATADAFTLTGLPRPCDDDYAFKGMRARGMGIVVRGNTALMALDGSLPDQTYLMGIPMTAGASYTANNLNEIRQARFIDYASGSASTVIVTCYF